MVRIVPNSMIKILTYVLDSFMTLGVRGSEAFADLVSYLLHCFTPFSRIFQLCGRDHRFGRSKPGSLEGKPRPSTGCW